jgi:hypothetical protein
MYHLNSELTLVRPVKMYMLYQVINDSSIEINLYDSTKDNLLSNPPVMYHLYFRTDMDSAGVDTYTPDGGWKNIGLTTQPCPVKDGKTYNITLESHTGFIRVGNFELCS